MRSTVLRLVRRDGRGRRQAGARVPAVRFITNVHLSYLVKSLKLNVYLHKPNVFLDGSKYEAFIHAPRPTSSS